MEPSTINDDLERLLFCTEKAIAYAVVTRLLHWNVVDVCFTKEATFLQKTFLMQTSVGNEHAWDLTNEMHQFKIMEMKCSRSFAGLIDSPDIWMMLRSRVTTRPCSFSFDNRLFMRSRDTTPMSTFIFHLRCFEHQLRNPLDYHTEIVSRAWQYDV